MLRYNYRSIVLYKGKDYKVVQWITHEGNSMCKTLWQICMIKRMTLIAVVVIHHYTWNTLGAPSLRFIGNKNIKSKCSIKMHSRQQYQLCHHWIWKYNRIGLITFLAHPYYIPESKEGLDLWPRCVSMASPWWSSKMSTTSHIFLTM